jgi:CheY-like chemotaxis protein/anti-sigma regulatory factor (Ser/Thr protein kinase)
MSLSGEPVALTEVLLECRAMVEDQARQRGIGMTFARLEAPRFVKADRTRLKQVLINLLFNAIKYNQSGGHVTVVCTLSGQGRVRISVRDTGPGLTTEQLGQLFQPFNRLGQETGGEEGTGIGLVVTKRLVELMGGVIGVESTPGVGSVFWVEMPLTAAPQSLANDPLALEAPRAEVPLGAPQHTVLYVEDNPANLELVELIMARRTDLRLLGAADASVGIEFARVYRPEVILMDINLPGISGVEAMKILRADPTTAHIPIIALSANAVPRDIARAMAAGFFNYITKPIKVTQFLEVLDQALAFAQTDRGTALTKDPA